MLDSQLRSKTGTEPGKVMGILPAAANDVPSRVHKIMLPTEPFAGVLAYFLLLVAKLRLAIGLDDDLQIRKDNIPEIGVVSYPDGTTEMTTRPEYRLLMTHRTEASKNVVASSVCCSDDAVRALAPIGDLYAALVPQALRDGPLRLVGVTLPVKSGQNATVCA